MSEVKLEDIVSLCKRRGFIFQGSEVYGGLSGTWDYGPLGITLKRNIENLWWKTFVDDRDDMIGVDAAILMNQKTWQASGHVDTFTDPMVECSNCHGRFREDHLKADANTEENLNKLFDELQEKQKSIESKIVSINKEDYKTSDGLFDWEKLRVENLEQYKLRVEDDIISGRIEAISDIQDSGDKLGTVYVKCPACGKIGTFGEARQFNMMFKTNIGPVESDDNISYLRPETAQGIFTNYKNVVDTLYPNIPFGIAQIGKAFRNEISPRDFVFRSREFNQMEIEYFIREDDWQELFEKWRNDIKDFLASAGVDMDKVEELEVPEDDLAHYSKRTVDFEFKYPQGNDELLGLAYRTDFDLTNIQNASGKNMEYRPKDGSAPFVPHVIEPSFGLERLVMAILLSAYSEDEQNNEKRIFLKLPEHIAPVKYCVSPLLKNKPELVDKAREVYAALKKRNAVMWDDNGNIGKRYRRQDEIGTPYCVVIDFDTLDDGTVTIRDRDTTEQKRVKIEELI